MDKTTGVAAMDLKTLHSADRVRHALAGQIVLTNDERDDAILAAIAKVERAALLANAAHEHGFRASEELWDKLADTHFDLAQRLLALPVQDQP